jgi:hypothetical protein
MDYIYIKKDNGRDFEKCFLLEHQNKYKNKCFDDIERIVDTAKQDYQYTSESNTERLRGIDENRNIEKQLNRENEYFEIGEDIKIAKKDKIEDHNFNDHVMNELSLLKQRQKERREQSNG